MRRSTFRVSTLMLVVALAGLNAASAVRTLRAYPLPALPVPVFVGNGRGGIGYGSDGSVSHYAGNAETGYRLVHVEWPTPRPTLLEIWTPLIASVAFSLVVVGGVIRASRRGGARVVGGDAPDLTEGRRTSFVERS